MIARAVFGFALTAFAAWPAIAGERANETDTQKIMGGFFGNTSVCKGEGLFECHVWFYPDGTMVQFSYDKRENPLDGGNNLSGFTVIPGTWWVEHADGGNFNLCRHVGDGPIRCIPQPPRKVGDHWDLPHTTGSLAGVTEH